MSFPTILTKVNAMRRAVRISLAIFQSLDSRRFQSFQLSVG